MGAWSVDAFGNDHAADWANELKQAEDLAPIREALAAVLAVGDEYVEAPEASAALAAVEVLARLNGSPGEKNSYTEAADRWVANTSAKPTPELIAKAQAVIARILAENSELDELWKESSEYGAWLASVRDLRARVGA
jgi:hypothetical protein